MKIKPGYLVGYHLEGKHQIAVVQAVEGDRVVVEGGELLIADLIPPF